MQDNFKGIAGPWECEASEINSITICSEKEEIATVTNEDSFLLSNVEWANARLIAAAPELLTALNGLIFLHSCEQEGLSSGQPTREEWLKAYEAGVAALEKATKI